jgi:hypothetical protein
LWDWISYQRIHNATVLGELPQSTLDQLRHLADQWEWQTNANISVDNGVRAIGGATLATQIVHMLSNSVADHGTTNKLNLLFTSFEPLMALTSLMGLGTNLYENFYGMPGLASSYVFELFSLGTSADYPNPTDLNVRFLFRNGTGSPDNLDTYPIFGNDATSMSMSLAQFQANMVEIGIPNIATWCSLCSSAAVFCPAYLGSGNSGSSEPASGSVTSPSGAKVPAVAGVIGALIGIFLVGVILALMMVFGGLRFTKTEGKLRRSTMGGFKGSEKLKSDPDLPKGGIVVGASVIAESAPGHRRVESWELREAAAKRDFEGERSSLDGGEIRPRESV